jgi:hypothetical protein
MLDMVVRGDIVLPHVVKPGWYVSVKPRQDRLRVGTRPGFSEGTARIDGDINWVRRSQCIVQVPSKAISARTRPLCKSRHCFASSQLSPSFF